MEKPGFSRSIRRLVASACLASVVALAVAQQPMRANATSRARTPIKHVVLLIMENHSFDNVLAGVCVADHLHCDAATTGRLSNGKRIRLAVGADKVPELGHGTPDQNAAIDHGRMDGFDRVVGCKRPPHLCYSTYRPSQIPNIRRLADHYVISDRTFSDDPVPSFGAHMTLIAGRTDGFAGENPAWTQPSHGPGWGCDSKKDIAWSGNPGAAHPVYTLEPSCVPRPDGFGPYRPSPVKYIPTILDRLDAAGVSWKLYAVKDTTKVAYSWSICPTFAECLFDKANGNRPNPNYVPWTNFGNDARTGRLPAYSVILPEYSHSQHNEASMKIGDNYVAAAVGAVMRGPRAQWKSTVIFLTWDDCGCFYDHVAPPARSHLGIREPMLIISPLAKARFTDHTLASFDSMLTFVEQNWRLPPLFPGEGRAYDYCRSFVFRSLPCTGPAAGSHAAPAAARAAPLQVPLAPSPLPPAARALLHVQGTPGDPT